jgi:predicted alpha/beta-hydrolase family hydrolase
VETARSAGGEPFRSSAAGDPPVSGFLHCPAGARDGLVLAHGAGGDANAPLLRALAASLAEAGVAVLRVDLPFRLARRKGPPNPSGAASDRDGLRRAASELRAMLPGRVAIGGQSYGGRQASMLLAEEPDAAESLLLLSYPLHPPGRAGDLRTAHFARLVTPTLFAHGSLDPFGTLEEIEAARALIPGPTALLAIQGAGHGLGRGTRAAPATETVATVVAAFLSFTAAHGRTRGG